MDTKAINQTFAYLAQKNSPCDKYGGCENRERCGQQQLACFAFANYVMTGKTSPAFGQKPSRAMFDMVENSQGFRGQGRFAAELQAMRDLAEQGDGDPEQIRKDWLYEINNIPFQGRNVTLNELAALLGSPRTRLYRRLRLGWTVAEIITGARAA